MTGTVNSYPPNGNEEGLQRSECPIFTLGKTNVRVSNGKKCAM